jgi:hypothetical protein
MEIQEVRVQIPLSFISSKVVVSQIVEYFNNYQEQ